MSKHITFKGEVLEQTGSDSMRALGMVLITVGIAAALYFAVSHMFEDQSHKERQKDKDDLQSDPALKG